MHQIVLGIENLIDNHIKLIKNRTIGIVAHPASTNSRYEHILPILIGAKANVTALFGPEHGFGGEAQDMESVSSKKLGPNNIPLYSLYGASENTLAPSPEQIKDLDALVVDLADVGSRYYTFVWTAVLCLRICHQTGTPLILLDRPNPIDGVTVEGSPQHPNFLSFVGLVPIANRHGLTIGEILTFVAHKENLQDALTVIPMNGWHRHMYFEDTGLPWIAPSPNMPAIETAVIYPGGCLLEATWASEGRGTTLPFHLFGAPHLDSLDICKRLNNIGLGGVHFRSVSFKPMFQKHSNTLCSGAQLHITNRRQFLPYRTGVAILSTLYQIAPDHFKWRTDPYEFIDNIPAIDLLTGSDEIRTLIMDGAPIDELAQTWKRGEKEFKREKKQFHLYE